MVIGSTYVELSESNMCDVRFVNLVHVCFLSLSFFEVQISKAVLWQCRWPGLPEPYERSNSDFSIKNPFNYRYIY